MAKTPHGIEIPSLGSLDRKIGNVGQQLVQRLREAIQKGELKAGERLPSTRALASSLGLSRGTVTQAFDQLKAEGYLDGRIGAGTTVAQSLTDHSRIAVPIQQLATSGNEPELPPHALRYADVARRLAALPSIPFSIAVPVGEAAPDDTWRRLSNRIRATQAAAPATYGDPRGLFELL